MMRPTPVFLCKLYLKMHAYMLFYALLLENENMKSTHESEFPPAEGTGLAHALEALHLSMKRKIFPCFQRKQPLCSLIFTKPLLQYINSYFHTLNISNNSIWPLQKRKKKPTLHKNN